MRSYVLQVSAEHWKIVYTCYLYFVEEPEFNIGDQWKWGIFRYNPNDSDVITYKATGYNTGRLSINLAHKTAYLYIAFLIICVSLFFLIGNGTIKV